MIELETLILIFDVQRLRSIDNAMRVVENRIVVPLNSVDVHPTAVPIPSARLA